MNYYFIIIIIVVVIIIIIINNNLIILIIINYCYPVRDATLLRLVCHAFFLMEIRFIKSTVV